MQVPVKVVLGRPIPVPHISDPDRETVDKYLNIFIEAISSLVEEHKADAGASRGILSCSTLVVLLGFLKQVVTVTISTCTY